MIEPRELETLRNRESRAKRQERHKLKLTDPRYRQRQKAARDASRFAKYGLTRGGFEALWQVQDGACLICREPFASESDAQIDHDHAADPTVVRGLLCRSHNLGLGHFQDKPEYLTEAVTYLQKAQAEERS